MVEHPGALFADFREFFHCSPADIPLPETCLLLMELLKDPRSRVQSALAGWSYPVSREWELLAQMHDVSVGKSGVKQPQKYFVPRPWKNAGRPKRKPRSVDELRRILKPWDSVVAAGEV